MRTGFPLTLKTPEPVQQTPRLNHHRPPLLNPGRNPPCGAVEIMRFILYIHAGSGCDSLIPLSGWQIPPLFPWNGTRLPGRLLAICRTRIFAAAKDEAILCGVWWNRPVTVRFRYLSAMVGFARIRDAP
jgi:hypothetical protein